MAGAFHHAGHGSLHWEGMGQRYFPQGHDRDPASSMSLSQRLRTPPPPACASSRAFQRGHGPCSVVSFRLKHRVVELILQTERRALFPGSTRVCGPSSEDRTRKSRRLLPARGAPCGFLLWGCKRLGRNPHVIDSFQEFHWD